MGMPDQPPDVLFVQTVENIPEVVSVDLTALRKLVWEVVHELRLSLAKRIDSLESELIIDRHVDKLDLLELKQLLLAAEDLLEEVLVQHGLRWQIQLHCTGSYRMK